MRDWTKSMMSFSWAMSLYGLRQMTSTLSPESWCSAPAGLDALTRSTEQQLGPAVQSLFRTGDDMQRRLVDLAFDMLTLGNGDVGGLMQRSMEAARRAAETGTAAVQQAAQGVQQAATSVASGAGRAARA